MTEKDARQLATTDGVALKHATHIDVHAAVRKDADGTGSVNRPESPLAFSERAKGFGDSSQHGRAVVDGLHVEVYTSRQAEAASRISAVE
ncbi:MAG: hypothetical protein H7338_12780 [Candidatus Sericytochromatia bacterium]|nr:hypothetical protein [Candidatus Sericytochromatia bacterium]